MYLIDQHRAHERVLFERLREQAREGTGTPQSLLEGIVLDLTPGQAARVLSRLPELADAGFVLEPFGTRSFVVRAVPEALRERPGLLETVAEAIEELLREVREDWIEGLLTAVACHSRQSRRASASRWRRSRGLLLQLEQTRFPTTCPHANPIIAHLSNTQLERQFGR